MLIISFLCCFGKVQSRIQCRISQSTLIRLNLRWVDCHSGLYCDCAPLPFHVQVDPDNFLCDPFVHLEPSLIFGWRLIIDHVYVQVDPDMFLCHPFEKASRVYRYAKGIDVTSSNAVLELSGIIESTFNSSISRLFQLQIQR